jgi:hypothetical protein
MTDFTIALFLQLGLLILLGRLLPARRTENAASTWSASLPFESNWEAAQRMIEREYGASSRRGGYEEEE